MNTLKKTGLLKLPVMKSMSISGILAALLLVSNRKSVKVKYKGKKYLQSYKNFIVNSLFEAAIQMSLHCKGLDGTATFMLPIFVIGKYNRGKWLPALLAQYFSVFVVD